jgi:hypothetical protein
MDVLVTKPFSQLRHPEIPQSHPKQKFSIFVLTDVFWNAPQHPIIILGPMQMIGCLGYETISPTSVPRRSAFTLETQVLRIFTFRRFIKCSKTTPINNYGPELYNGCFGYKTMFATSVPQNNAFKRETQVLHLFTFCMFPKCSEKTIKHNFRSNADEWMLWLRNNVRNFGTPK